MLQHTMATLSPQTHATHLVRLLIATYFSTLSSVLIVHDSSSRSVLLQEYLDAVQESFRHQSWQVATGSNTSSGGGSDSIRRNDVVGLQWIDVGALNETELDEQMRRSVDIVTEGFITILPDTGLFLHARYSATRHAELRLKDKFYLFLCEFENPEDFLATEILQFYPHHLMVRPATVAAAGTRRGGGGGGGASMHNVDVTEEAEPKPKPAAERTTKITNTSLNKYTDSAQSAAAAASTTSAADAAVSAAFACCAGVAAHRDINFELWTQKFVGAVGNLDAVLLDAFLPNETFAQNVELYPNKVLNLRGRTLRVGSITYIPYVVTNSVAAGTGNADPINSDGGNRSVFYVGSEAEIVKTFCQVRNCHLRVEPYGVDNWGIIYDNETSSGMLGDIYTQRVELAIGCIYNWYNNITETSHTIARSAVTLLGPAPAQFPAWRTTIIPFTAELWTFLLSTMFLCSIVLYFVKLSAFTLKNMEQNRQRKFRHLEAYEQAMLDIVALYIQQPSAPLGLNRFPGRIFLATLLCATITLENTYSGQLKSFLTIPFYSEPVDTMDKWSQTDWLWAAPSIIWVQTVEKSEVVKEQILTKKFEIHDYDFLYNASFRADYGLGIERLLSGSFSFGEFITSAALETKIVPKDDLYFDWTRAVAIRGWPLMPLFNQHVRICMETGLFVHWERQIVAKYLDRQTQDIMLDLGSGHTSKAPLQKLTVINISGAIFALLIGYLLAALALLLELFGYSLMLKMVNFRRNLIGKLQ